MAYKQREHWVDFLKGVCALCVMLTHIPDTPMIYRVFYSYFMLPSFFFASGYLTKNEKPIDFLYNRVFKLLILYFMYSFLEFILSFDNIILLFKSQIAFLNSFCDSFIEMLCGQGLWFISCLVVVSLMFFLIKAIARDKANVMLTISAIVAVTSLVFTKDGRTFWNVTTSLACQFFFVSGFLVKEKKLLQKIKHVKTFCAISGALYLMLIYGAYFVAGEEFVAITVGTNTWKFLPITIPALVSGNFFVILLSKLIDKTAFINYIGKHALIYYAFGGRGLSIASKLLSLTGINNLYLLNLLIVLVAALIMLVPCLIIDRFFPFFNGSFKLPALKTKAE